MNIIDLIIILFIISSVVRGYHIGLVRQAGSTFGFIAGLFLGSWIGGTIARHETGTLNKSLTSLLIVLGVSFFCMSMGELAGTYAKRYVREKHPLDTFDGGFGSAMAVATLLLAVWLAASILVLGPASGFQQALKGSRIIAGLNRSLPPATKILSSLNTLINPNGFPEVFRGLEPSPQGNANLPSLGSFNKVVADTEASVVKIEGTGCGGIVEGSGFVIAKGMVATNAHVVAGVGSPKILDANGTHDTRVIWFDPNVDLAVLQTNNLAGKPLAINAAIQPDNTPAIIAGYPGGGDFNVQAAAVIDHFTAYGRNIYNQGTTARDIYSVKAHVIPGNSGGPLIDAHDQVVGIVFATSTTYNNVGYALTGHQVAGELATAEQSTTTRSTGTCSNI